MQTLERPITHDEFRAKTFAPQEEKEHVFELVNGEIVAKNNSTATHQRVLRRLSSLFDAAVSKDKLGEGGILRTIRRSAGAKQRRAAGFICCAGRQSA